MARYYATTNNANWGMFYDVTEGPYSIETNASSVYVNIYLYRPSSSSYYGGTATISMSVDGQVQSTTITPTYPTNIGVGESSAHLMASFGYTISHNNDGSKTIGFSLSWNANFNPTSASGSDSMVLTTIPRASEISSVSTVNIGSNATITVNRKSSSFTHTITYLFGDLSGTIVTKSSNTSISWTIPTSFYTKIPNAKTGVGNLFITTYNGNTQIGSTSSKQFTVTTNENFCKPTLSGSVVDSNQDTIAITGDDTILIAGYSTANVSYRTAPRNSASVKKVTVNSLTAYSGSSVGTVTGTKELTSFNANTIDIVSTDSREYSAINTLTAGTDYTLIPYIPITFNGEVTRQTPTGNTLLLSFSGNYYSGSLGETTNSLTIIWKWRIKGDTTWETGGTLVENTDYVINTNDNTYHSGTGQYQSEISLGNGFNYQTNYEIGIFYTDVLITDRNVILLGKKGIPVFNWGDDYFNINGDLLLYGTPINGEILFESSVGTQNEITLSDDWANYRFMDVIWQTGSWDENDNDYDNLTGMNRIPVVANSYLMVGGTVNSNKWSFIGWHYTSIKFTGTNKIAQPFRGNSHIFNGSSNTYSTSNDIYIIKVIGYK